MRPRLIAQDLTMSYPGVRALAGVDFDLRAGEIHALCGENGAGKSTLIKILCGVIDAGSHGGTVTLDGSVCRFTSPGDALRAGVRVIHQELALCADLSVTENIFLGEEIMGLGGSWGIPDARRMTSETRAALDALGLTDVAPQALVGGLPVGLRQMVEIARALKPSHDQKSMAKVLILDEPTSALSAREAERLIATLQNLRAEGLAILYISHRLDEVFRLADRITVLRNGETTGTLARAPGPNPFDASHVVALMTGGNLSRTSIHPPGHRVDALARTYRGAGGALGDREDSPSSSSIPLLSVRDWTVADPANPSRAVVDHVSFDVRAGEILGFAGLMGAGRTELMESLCGLYPTPGRGAILIENTTYVPRDAAHAQRHGIALVCEDRRGRGLFADKSVRVNMTISALRDFCSLGWLTQDAPKGRERTEAQTRVDALRVKTPSTEFIAGNLSGGNQQKALLARALLTRPKILILDEPTRGIDVGAKEELYALITALAADGMAVLLVSSETEEVLRLAHRVVILRAGRLVGEQPAASLTLTQTLALCAGGTPT